MPYCEIHTPVELSETAVTDLLAQITNVINQTLNVSISYIMCSYIKKHGMSFGGVAGNCAFIRITTIAQPTEAKNSSLAANISAIISEKCKIDKQNIFMEFAHAPGKNFAQGGALFG